MQAKSPACCYEFQEVPKPSYGNSSPINSNVHDWLLKQARQTSENSKTRWVTATPRGGIKFKNHVGAVQAPDGTQIEILPKIYKVADSAQSKDDSRRLLVEMLCCLREFRHADVGSAVLNIERMPLLEVFIVQFLASVAHAVKRGLRSNYEVKQDNLFALRGKLLVSQQIRQNLVRPDRFFTEHDEFTTNRPENRLMRLALERVMKVTVRDDNQRLARELLFAFAGIPASVSHSVDFQQVRLDRGMDHYASAMDWTRWVLNHLAPVPTSGKADAPALLYPMETLFEAFVAKQLRRQLKDGEKVSLHTQKSSKHLVQHKEQNWFELKPDLVAVGQSEDRNGKPVPDNKCVLDTKWKLLDQRKGNSGDKYGIDQGDLYQLQAHGLSYLGSGSDVVLIYPKTEQFDKPLPVFKFNRTQQAEDKAKHRDITLWVLPFCLTSRKLLLPEEKCDLHELFESNADTASVQAKAA